MKNRNRCPSCGNLHISGVGLSDSPILILGDYPSFEDAKTGVCMSDENLSYVLQTELGKVGIPLKQCYYTNLWSHVYSEECEKYDDMVDEAAKLISSKKKVLMLGSDVTVPFLGYKATDICGVWFQLEAFGKTRIMPCITIGTVLNQDLGEFRLALNRFAKETI